MNTLDQIKDMFNLQTFAAGVGSNLGGGMMDKLTRGMRSRGLAMGVLRTGLGVGARIAASSAFAAATIPLEIGAQTIFGKSADALGYSYLKRAFNPNWGKGYTSVDQDLMERNSDSVAAFLKYGSKRHRMFMGASLSKDNFGESKYELPEEMRSDNGWWKNLWGENNVLRRGYDPKKDLYQDRDVITHGDSVNQRLGSQDDDMLSALHLINRARERQINTSGTVGF